MSTASNVSTPDPVAPAAWPRGFRPADTEPDAAPALAALRAHLSAGPPRGAFSADVGEVAGGGAGAKYIAHASSAATHTVETAEKALDLLASALGAPAFLRALDGGYIPTVALGAPALTFEQGIPNKRAGQPGGSLHHDEHVCALTRVRFSVPAGSPVPVLRARAVSGTEADRIDGGATGWSFTVCPALVDAGPQAVANAILHRFLTLWTEWRDRLYQCAEWASLAASCPEGWIGVEWPADAYRDKVKRTEVGWVDGPAGYTLMEP